MQDTATQAMTEVALGLSMAFFALLILALISIGLPANTTQVKQGLASISVNNDESISLSAQDTQLSDTNMQTKSREGAVQSQSKDSILLYWKGRYFDTDMHRVNLPAYIQAKHQDTKTFNIVVAVPEYTAFNDLLTIQAAFKPIDIQVTKFTPQWLEAFNRQSL